MSVPEEPFQQVAPAPSRDITRRIAWEIGELVIGYGLILAVIWTPRPLQHWLYFIALGWFIVSITLSFESWKAMGCCVAGFWRSSWIVGVALILAGVATFFAGTLHTLHHPGGPAQWVLTFGGYTVWALMQQLLLAGILPGAPAAHSSQSPTSPRLSARFSLRAGASAQSRPHTAHVDLGTGRLSGLHPLAQRLSAWPSLTPSSASASPSRFPHPCCTTCASALAISSTI